jgi:Cu(I)-responsive transcriptional regulator
MNIARAARRAGLTAKALRYYEEIGLLSAGRRENGYRDYDEADVARLVFLAQARRLGFSVAECRQLLALWGDDGRASADVKALVLDHIRTVEAKIDELGRLRDTLAGLADRCHGDARPDCAILTGLGATAAPAPERRRASAKLRDRAVVAR